VDTIVEFHEISKKRKRSSMKYIIKNLISFTKVYPKVIHDIFSTKIHDKVINFMSVSYFVSHVG